MRILTLRIAALAALSLSTQAALADDWNVTRLRGEVMQFVDRAWLPLERNDVVPDDRRIRTSNNGHATLVRGHETLELGPSTQIRIIDEGSGKPYTTVLQSWGTVSIEAEVRNVEHFAVRNQYLAAVVKGTRFTVAAKSSGGGVDVDRGRVSVSGAEAATVVAAGQQASVDADGSLSVSGDGILPAVVATTGKPGYDAAAEATAAADAALEAAKAKSALRAIEAAEKAAAKAAADAGKAAEKAAKDADKNLSSGEDSGSQRGKGDKGDKGDKGSGPGSGKGKP